MEMIEFEKLPNTILNGLDFTLSNQWILMKRFCLLMSLAASTHCKLPEQNLVENMAAIPYPLLHEQYETGTLAEAIRLGMLAFSSHIFLQWHNIKPPYTYFSTKYRECYDCMTLSAVSPPDFTFWYMIIGYIAVFEMSDNDWLISALRLHIKNESIKSWSQARDILNGFFWIFPLHEHLGKALFDSIS
jgi:hypothetical protein